MAAPGEPAGVLLLRHMTTEVTGREAPSGRRWRSRGLEMQMCSAGAPGVHIVETGGEAAAGGGDGGGSEDIPLGF